MQSTKYHLYQNYASTSRNQLKKLNATIVSNLKISLICYMHQAISVSYLFAVYANLKH